MKVYLIENVEDLGEDVSTLANIDDIVIESSSL